MKKTLFTLLILVVCAIQHSTAYEYFTIYFSDGTKSEAFYATDVDSICYSKIGLDSIAYDDWQVQEIYTIDSVYRYPLILIDSLCFKDVDVNKSFDILNELCSITANGQQLEIEDVIMYVKKHFDNANIEIRDSIIYLDIEGFETLRLDIYGKYMMDTSDWELDSLALLNRMDSIMHVLGRDVPDTISTIFSDSVFLEDDFNYSQSRQMNYRRAANVTNSPTILTNNNLLIWSPWYYTESRYEHKLIFETINTFASNLNKRRPEAMKLSPTQADGASLANIASMRTFSNYDVVFIDCHGTENGELIMPITTDTENIPGDIVGIMDNSTKKIVPGKVLDEKHMRRYLPKRLDHTILFTAMCYAYPTKNRQSLLYKIATERKVADYMGATNSVTVRTPLDRFVDFATTFFLGGTPTTKAFNGGPYTDKYLRDDKVITASGQYKHARIVDDVFYGFARPLPYNKQNQSMKGRMPFPQNYLPQAHAREGFRSAKSISSNFTNDNIEAGFMLKNLTTGDVQSIPLTKDNVTDYQIYPLGNIMVDVVFEVKTDRLEPGRYAYSTYIWNGESLKLSNDAQEFTINAEPYYVWNEKDSVATYYYDGLRESRGGCQLDTITLEVYNRDTDTKQQRKHVHVKPSAKKVIFDKSFSNYYPNTFSFFECWCLQNIENMNYLNTDSITDMRHMFSGCTLKSLDLSHFNTSNVTDMSGMFWGCYIMSLDLSNFNTSNVTDMSDMFNSPFLTSLDLSNFDTSNVIDMSYMFYRSLTTLNFSNLVLNGDCGRLLFSYLENLQTINLTNANTSNATDMSYMFAGCSSLTNLDLSSFDTSNVTDMTGMFSECSSLTTLDLSNFDTSNLIYMGDQYDVISTGHNGMFSRCKSLTSLDLSNFDTSNVLSMRDMFAGCSSLTSLDFSNLVLNGDCGRLLFSYLKNLQTINLTNANTSNATDMYGMFYLCGSLTILDLSSFDTSNVTDMGNMFYRCSSLTSLDLGNFDTSNVIYMGGDRYRNGGMFYGCLSLTSLNLSSFDTSNATDMYGMFSGCSSLTSLNLSSFDTSNVTDMGGMFGSCNFLTGLNLSSFDTSNATDMSYMFAGCSSLTSLDLSSFNTSNVTSMSYMFDRCGSLKTIYADNWNLNDSVGFDMFASCTNLVGGKGTKIGNNLYGYDKNGNSLYYYCSADASAAHVDSGKDWPGLFTAK